MECFARKIPLQQRFVAGQHHGVFKAVRVRHGGRFGRTLVFRTADTQQRALGELLLQVMQRRFKIAARTVELIDKHHAGQAELLNRAAEDFRLRLHALHGGDDQHGAVQHRKRALRLADEIGMPRGVDQVDNGIFRLEHGVRCLDRDAARLLDRERIRLRRAEVNRARRAQRAAVKQKLLRQARLARVDMRHNADVDFPLHHSTPPHPKASSPVSYRNAADFSSLTLRLQALNKKQFAIFPVIWYDNKSYMPGGTWPRQNQCKKERLFFLKWTVTVQG